MIESAAIARVDLHIHIWPTLVSHLHCIPTALYLHLHKYKVICGIRGTYALSGIAN